MNCEHAAEFVSALFDGERIPQEAAEHVGACAACSARMQDYAVMSAELRRSASAGEPTAIPERLWQQVRLEAVSWSFGWRETMRIPRFVFALLLMAVVFLSGGLVLVKARSGGNGPALVITTKLPKGSTSKCAMPTNRGSQKCTFGTDETGGAGHLICTIHFIQRDDQRVQLGIRIKLFSLETELPHENIEKIIADVPEQQFWLDGDKPYVMSVPNLGPVEFTREFADEGSISRPPGESLNPGPHQFRMLDPVVIRDNQVIANFSGASASFDGDIATLLYAPKVGRFIISTIQPEQLKGNRETSPAAFGETVEGQIEQHQIRFALHGKPYLILTGAPISRAERVWVIYQPAWRPSKEDATSTDDHEMFSVASPERLFGIQQK